MARASARNRAAKSGSPDSIGSNTLTADGPPEDGVFGPPDLAHPAPGDPLDQHVAHTQRGAGL